MNNGVKGECPVKLPEPASPRYWLWGIAALCLSLLFCLGIVITSRTEWYSMPLLGCLFVTLAMAFFSLRVIVAEKNKLFITAWNEEREKYLVEYVQYQRKALRVLQQVIYTSTGVQGNSELVWHEETLHKIKEDYTQYSEDSQDAALVLDRILDEEFLALLRRLPGRTIFLTGGLRKQQIEEFVQAWSGFSIKHQLNHELLVQSGDHPFTWFNQWIDGHYHEKGAVVIAADPLPDKPSCIAFLFSGRDDSEGSTDSHVKIHRPFFYEKNKKLKQTQDWSGVALTDIEAVWCSGINQSLRTEILLNMQSDAPDANPKFLEVDKVLGHSAAMAGWLTLALATERAKNSRKAQLVVSLHEGVVMQIVSFNEKDAR
ncbi:hypothetical protein J0B02_10690 [Enterobacteriaceae bacterium YMB-R22]|uniref:hypothetical protein n=1 Tax=Tenebrionicola larvae TaxID=2815733 RepID=UPI0020131D98|nr:hypothetical protein [Tenebrionicola larvae]MBV4413280.1 hypothetical protein [Tenebrionicola larvae]